MTCLGSSMCSGPEQTEQQQERECIDHCKQNRFYTGVCYQHACYWWVRFSVNKIKFNFDHNLFFVSNVCYFFFIGTTLFFSQSRQESDAWAGKEPLKENENNENNESREENDYSYEADDDYSDFM